MYGYIYIVTNNINGKIYIGKHKGSFNINYLGSGKYIRSAISKYGKDNFSVNILKFTENEFDAIILEKYFIKKYNSIDNNIGYNISLGGPNPIMFGKHNPRYGVTVSEETRRKLSESLIGHKHTQEFKDKIRKTMTSRKQILTPARQEQYRTHGDKIRGYKWSEERRSTYVNPFKGKKRGPLTDEHRRKLSEAHKGRGHKLTDETRRKISETKRANPYIMSEEQKQYLRSINIGKSVSEETKKKISETFKRKREFKKIIEEKKLNETLYY